MQWICTGPWSSVGEPFKSAFDPTALTGDLHAHVFDKIEVVETSTLNARLFNGRSEGLRLLGGQMMRARR